LIISKPMLLLGWQLDVPAERAAYQAQTQCPASLELAVDSEEGQASALPGRSISAWLLEIASLNKNKCA
jgi:hypothetical protein